MIKSSKGRVYVRLEAADLPQLEGTPLSMLRDKVTAMEGGGFLCRVPEEIFNALNEACGPDEAMEKFISRLLAASTKEKANAVPSEVRESP